MGSLDIPWRTTCTAAPTYLVDTENFVSEQREVYGREDKLFRGEYFTRLPGGCLGRACLHTGLRNLPGRYEVLEERGVGPVVLRGGIEDTLGGLVGVSNGAAHSVG